MCDGFGDNVSCGVQAVLGASVGDKCIVSEMAVMI